MNRWYHPEFEKDLTAAAIYYEQQRRELGAEFLDEAEQAIEVVHVGAQRWPVRVGGVRRCLVARFPYVVRHRLTPAGDTVQFLSVLHGSATS